jgi:hypothetical protein
MKNTILIILLSFIGSSIHSAPIPSQDPLKVIAFSGLKLRTSPDMNGKVLKVIPFGEKVFLKERQNKSLTVEWLEGQWALVEFEGKSGYVLDAFLTSLPIPMNDYELSQSDADISFPLLSWVEHNFKLIAKTDTVENQMYTKIVQHFEKGITVSRKEGPHAYQLVVEIPGIRLGDAYNLSRSLLLTKLERKLFEESSVFISNESSTVDKVKIDLDAPIEIKKLNGGVEIKVLSYQQVCGL